MTRSMIVGNGQYISAKQSRTNIAIHMRGRKKEMRFMSAIIIFADIV